MKKINYPILIIILLSPILLKNEYIAINQEIFVIFSFLLVFYYMYKFTKEMIIEELNYRENAIKNAYVNLLKEIIKRKKMYMGEYQNEYLTPVILGEVMGEYASMFNLLVKKKKELYLKKFFTYKIIELNVHLLRKVVSQKEVNEKSKRLGEKLEVVINMLKSKGRKKTPEKPFSNRRGK